MKIRIHESTVRVALGVLIIAWLNAMQITLHLEDRANLELRYQEKSAFVENAQLLIDEMARTVKHLRTQNQLLREQNDSLEVLRRLSPRLRVKFIEALYEVAQ